MGLKNLAGYLKSENFVVPITFEPNPVKPRQAAFLPRPIEPGDWPLPPSPDESLPPARNGTNAQRRRLESSRVLRNDRASSIEHIPDFD
jgi:hypothetical protein